MRKLNKKSLYQEGGMVPKDSIDPAIDELSKVVQARIESGEPAEQVLFSFLQEGMPQEQLALAFETVGYDPGLFTQLMQSVEQMAMQAQQQQEQPQASEQELLQQLEQATYEEQQMMQWGGNTTARGPLESLNPGVPRPLYMPVVPRRGNLINAAYLASDALGEMFSGKDRDGDGVMDGSFRDWSAKKARYKNKQLQNRTYEVDYGDLNPNDYITNINDLAEGKVKTKEEYTKDFFENSLIDFNPESGQYMAAFATRPEDYAMLGKKQKEQLGLLGPKKERKFSDPSSWFGREDAPIDGSYTLKQFVENLDGQEKTDLEMIREAMKYGPGIGLNLDRTSYDESILNPSQIEDSRNTYRDIMLGKASMKSEQPVFNFNQQEDFNAPAQRSIVQVPTEQPSTEQPSTEQPSTETPSREQQFKDWALQNPAVRMTTAGRQEFDRLNPMRYGGDLPKAQFGPPYDWDPNNPMGLPDFSQMGQTSYINPETGKPWAPGPDASPAVNANDPIELDEVVVTAQGTGGLKSKGLTPIPIEMPEMNLAPIAPIDLTVPTAPETVAQQPTVKRKWSLGNAFDQVETFIKDNPAMRAYGDVSQAAVMGANLANEWFQEKEYRDYKNKLRNSTMADKAYLATTNPSNKRGTFDVNLGLAEPDNLVDYYAQAMYGKELYKKGGEFEPHMMYDPVSGKAYEAKVEADHNRFAKMGFLHEDEMQTGGEVEVDNDTLAALIAAGADIEML
jgi:hypothetical protein